MTLVKRAWRHLSERWLYSIQSPLDSSEHFHNAAHTFADHGIQVGKPKIDVSQMMKRKSKVVDELVGIDYLMKKIKSPCCPALGEVITSGKSCYRR